MMLSRKEFLRRGLASLGEALLEPSSLVREPPVAVPRNDRCLAQRGGCFSCLESCPEEAIAIEPGQGIRIDEERCTGCGGCVRICPVTPKAVILSTGAVAKPR